MNKRKIRLSDDVVKQSLLMGGRFLVTNLFTSGIILIMVFTVSLVTGKELWLTNTIQTIMLPLVIWYYGNIAYRYGYQHSVSGTADIRCAWISMLPMLIVQFAFIFASMHEATIKPEGGTIQYIASYYLFSPFAILLNSFPNLMPELMFVPCIVPPIAIYVGYKMGMGKEVVDHYMGNDAKQFRDQVEEEQYGKDEKTEEPPEK